MPEYQLAFEEDSGYEPKDGLLYTIQAPNEWNGVPSVGPTPIVLSGYLTQKLDIKPPGKLWTGFKKLISGQGNEIL